MAKLKRLVGWILVLALVAGNLPFFANAGSAAEGDRKEEFTASLAQQLADIHQEKQALTPAQRKVDSNVRKVVGEARVRAAALLQGQPPSLRSLSTPLLKIDDPGNIEVKLTLGQTGAGQLQQLEARGMKIDRTLPEYGIVEGTIPYEQVEAVAGLDFVTNLTTPGYPLYKAGSVTSEGDAVTRAAEARASFPVDGAGVKVGVMSDGVSHLANSVATGDLPSSPAVDVRKSGSGDEGTAMLEIVHDLAPGAPLAFYGPTTSTDMVTGIRSLRDAGSRVIVDDITFFDEPKFEDGPIAAEARGFYTGGGTYVTAAGNSALTHYAHSYTRIAGPITAPRGSYPYAHNYNPGGTTDIGNTFTLPNGQNIRTVLQWNDKWGQAGDDFDLFLANSTSGALLTSSTNIQNGSGNPWESLSYTNNTGASITVYIAVFEYSLTSAPSSLVLDYNVYNGYGPTLQYTEPASSVIGHEAVSEVISTAATNAATPTTIAPYSSRGPGKVYFPAYEERQTPNITGVDGVNTKVGQLGYFGNPFYGTSAAAPHVAAIAALVWQAHPSSTASQVRSALLSGTVDLGTTGWDTTWGFGRTDAYRAVASVYVTVPPTVTTGAADNLGTSSARLNGNLSALGTASTANVSFEWGTTSGSLNQQTPLQATSSAGAFSATIGSLSSNTAYYFRARADGAGTAYGTELGFTTTKALASIALTPASPSVPAGLTLQFNATGNYTDASTANLTASANWTSSNTGVATISSSGLGTAVASGTANIIATWGSISGSTTLTVSPAQLVSIVVTPAAPSVTAGLTVQFTATGNYTDAHTANITGSTNWTSSNTGVAAVNNAGLATALAQGTAVIRATSGAVSGNATLTVTARLVSISVTPPNAPLLPGRTQQFSATGAYSDNTTANLTGAATWTSSNASVAAINTSGLATALAAGATTITAVSGNVSANATLSVSTSVEINSGQTLTLVPSQVAGNISLSVKGIPATGVGKFILNLSWNKDVIRVDNITAGSVPGFQIFASVPNNAAGTANISGNTSGSYPTGNIIAANLGVTAVGNTGNSTSINITIAQLIDRDSAPISAVPVSAAAKIISMVAETSLSQGLSTTAAGVVVVQANINRIKDPSDNSTANLSGGIGSYRATVNGSPDTAIQFITVYGVAPFDAPSFNATSGSFWVSGASSPVQPGNTTLAEVAPVLTGNASTAVSLNAAFQVIGAACQSGLSLPEERPNTITLKRGDVKDDGVVDIFDALYIAQYIVGQRAMGQINPLNAASVKHDGSGGDKIDIFDALFIAQYIVAQKNAYFQ